MTPTHEVTREIALGFGAWLFGLLALGTVVLIVLRAAELQRFAELAQQAHPLWLAVAGLLQVLTYVCASWVWYAALRRAGVPRSLWSLLSLGVAKLFADQAVPSGGVSGTLLVLRGMARRGVPAPFAMGAMLVGLVSFYAAHAMAALGGFLAFQQHHALGPAIVAVAIFFGLFVIAVPAAVFWVRSVQARPWLQWLRRFRMATLLLESLAGAPSDLLHDHALLLRATGVQLAIILLDAATFGAMLHAVGQAPPAILIFAASVIADVVATLGPIPLGLGTFEGAAVAMLHMAGTSIEAALTATLLLRGATFWLPMLPGLWLARRELGGAAPPATR